MFLKFLFVFALQVFLTRPSQASLGDRTRAYTSCMEICSNTRCHSQDFTDEQPAHLTWLGWDCVSECQHSCMWETVKVFQELNQPIPQFHGKWPFVRLLGVQEPASVVFSIMNAMAHVIGFRLYRASVPTVAPMHGMATLQFVVGVSAWFWSAVFHTRDLPWTEKLDYFGATLLVAFHLYYAVYRWSYEISQNNRKLVRFISACLITCLYLLHISYLSFRKFDYGYNMRANVSCGALNSFAWLSLCYYKRKTHVYFYKIGVMILLTYLFLSLELYDFPPIYWTFDAHSLWHLGTIPMPLLFYSFCKDDSLYLLKTISID